MIFYFSGTGNSYAVARSLANALGERLIDIANAIRERKLEYYLAEGEKMGFVFPVYAWAPPNVVTKFAKHLELYFKEQPYTFAVCTCGGSAGKTMEHFEDALGKNGLVLDSGYSIVMPDNYVAGFDTEPVEKQTEKLKQAKKVEQLIIKALQQERKGFFRVKRGKLPWLLTAVVNPVFCGMATWTKPFYATSACIGCGLCQRVCTSDCIKVVQGMPVWTKKKCNMCLACLNRCPKKAIQYGKKTVGRGRYAHPCLKNKEGE